MTLSVLLRAALGLCLLSFVLLFGYSRRHAVDYRAEAAYSRDLRQLKASDAQLNEQLLRSVSGLQGHYDGLVRGVQELQDLHAALARIPPFLDDDVAAALRAELSASTALARDKAAAIESFKSQHAVLRNSLRYLPRAAADSASVLTEQRLDESTAAARDLMGNVLLADVAPDADAYAQLLSAIRRVERTHARLVEPVARQRLDLLMRHARIVAERKPRVDRLVQRVLAAPTGRVANRIEERYSAGYRAALDASAVREKALFALAFAVVLLATLEFILRVARSNAALAQATTELRSANAALAAEREKERELGELKTRFVSMTSHEFRTPLSSILSSSELLEKYGERWNADRRRGHLKQIQISARTMNHMLDEILVIGRAEAGALRAAPAPLALEDLCRRLIDTTHGASGGSHRIRLLYTGSASANLDERLLSHVLLNLLENAVKYSPADSEIVLNVEAGPTEVRFSVQDQGIGIPEPDLPGLFTSFRRGSNVGQVAGSGLGLAVVRRAVDVQGGSIEVTSEVGRGSEFSVRLPIAFSEQRVSA